MVESGSCLSLATFSMGHSDRKQVLQADLKMSEDIQTMTPLWLNSSNVYLQNNPTGGGEKEVKIELKNQTTWKDT